jgi:hypothetical protein
MIEPQPEPTVFRSAEKRWLRWPVAIALVLGFLVLGYLVGGWLG